MSTSTFESQPLTAPGEWPSGFPVQELCTISASRSVRADRTRLFQAITVPEYMEAWLSAPGSIPGHMRVFRRDDSFAICGLTEDGSEFKITCNYRVYRRSKVEFSWKQESPAVTNSSVVRIRLRGDFERTTAEVTHTGLTECELPWCERLWEASLEKLSRLF